MRYFHVTTVALLVLFSTTAFAETAWDVLERFGWTGTWALDCKNGPIATNDWNILFKDAGVAKRKWVRGADKPALMTTIDSARIITATTLQTRIRNDDPNWGPTNGMSFDVIQVKENGRLRTIESKGSDGKQYIKAGNFVSIGRPSLWKYKCPN